jgi:Flp pilus assembly protein TadB
MQRLSEYCQMTQHDSHSQPNNRLGTHTTPTVRGPLSTLFAVLSATVLLVLGFTFSLVIIAIAVVAGLIGFGYLWWKTRAFRRQIREQMAMAGQTQHGQPAEQDGGAIDGNVTEGEIIEGEVIREERESPK